MRFLIVQAGLGQSLPVSLASSSSTRKFTLARSFSAIIDFDSVFKSAGIAEAERDRVKKALELLAALPAETPQPIKKDLRDRSNRVIPHLRMKSGEPSSTATPSQRGVLSHSYISLRDPLRRVAGRRIHTSLQRPLRPRHRGGEGGDPRPRAEGEVSHVVRPLALRVPLLTYSTHWAAVENECNL